ncbi:patatin family protein, partial [Escherichia coli]
MERWLGYTTLQLQVNLVHHHETSLRNIQHFIEKPPTKPKQYTIIPHTPYHSSALGSRIPAQTEDYKLE